LHKYGHVGVTVSTGGAGEGSKDDLKNEDRARMADIVGAFSPGGHAIGGSAGDTVPAYPAGPAIHPDDPYGLWRSTQGEQVTSELPIPLDEFYDAVEEGMTTIRIYYVPGLRLLFGKVRLQFVGKLNMWTL
jgi:hypothetical protein